MNGLAPQKKIFDDVQVFDAENINPYLVDAPDVLVESRNKPICEVPEIGIGNKPIDGGHFLFSKDEMEAFIQSEPLSERYFRLWYGADEFINNRPRYFLYLGDCSPSEMRKMPRVLERVNAVRQHRQNSKSEGTRKIADNPTRFHVTNIPVNDFIVIPEISSENRRYVPIGFMSNEVLASNRLKIMPGTTRFHFGILTSNIHMAWMRAVAGRLEMRYCYSVGIVYNNFIWPGCTPEQKAKIERTAQGILDARAKYPNDSYADLYDDTVMPHDLRRAHQDNDRAVWEAYGRAWPIGDESACVAHLMKLYQAKVSRIC